MIVPLRLGRSCGTVVGSSTATELQVGLFFLEQLALGVPWDFAPIRADRPTSGNSLSPEICESAYLFGLRGPASIPGRAHEKLAASILEALGEAMALVREAGIDPAHCDDLPTSALLTGPLFSNCGALIAHQQVPPGRIRRPARREGHPARARRSGVTPRRDADGEPRHGEALDWSAIGQLAAEDAGLGVHGWELRGKSDEQQARNL